MHKKLLSLLGIYFMIIQLGKAQVNIFSPVTAITTGTGTCTTPGSSTAFTISTNNAAFSPGNKVLIIQMQGAAVNTTTAEPPTDAQDLIFGSITSYNGAGNYEFAYIATNTGGSPATITFTQNLVNTYNVAGKVQIVSVPQYSSHTIGAPLTGTAWNGSTGGVLVFDVAGTLTLSSTISMDGKGFRGGTTGNNGAGCNTGPYTSAAAVSGSAGRGEGIVAGADAYGRGAMANGGGGGGGHNAGGAGGANYCAGGRGGYEYTSCYSTTGNPVPYASRPRYASDGTVEKRHGRGGYSLTPLSSRIFMGGGGGAGNGDNTNYESPGGNGGGIIIISAAELAGTTGTISSSGLQGADNLDNDGSGGGGAGGSILLNVGYYSITTLNVSANGGRGGNNDQTGTCHGTGGGGGAGLIWTSGTSTTPNVIKSSLGGVAGRSSLQNTSDVCYNSTYGAADGNSCTPLNNLALNMLSCCSPANLGGDQPLCGSASIVLSNGTISNTNKVFKWYKDGVLISSATGPTYTATATGTYKVVVDSVDAGTGYTFCSTSDEMIVTSTMPAPYLGPDLNLCNPSSLTLSAANAASFPAGTSWQWSFDGSNVTGETASSLQDVREAGTYRLTATATGCTATFDDIAISSTLPVPVDACRGDVGPLTLSVSGGLGGPYSWYATSSDNTVLGTGSTFTTPALTATTTYYVKDAGQVNITTGPSTTNSFTMLGQNGNTAQGMTLYFDATMAFKINGMTVIVYNNSCSCGSSIVISLDFYNSSGTKIATTSNSVPCCPAGSPVSSYAYPLTFSSPVSIAAGTGYYVKVNPATTYTIGLYGGGNASYPATYSPVMKITGTANTSNLTQAPAYLDWKISYDPGCTRMPVVARIDPSCPPLPVQWISFTGEAFEKDVILRWSTATEINNNHFNVYRSTDGVHFEFIGTLKGSGTSSEVKNYYYTDKDPAPGKNYYQLEQVDMDGQNSRSNIILVNREQKNTIAVYPNPFTRAFNVVTHSSTTFPVEIRVFDLSGKLVELSAGHFSNETVSVGESLPQGSYLVEVISQYESKTVKMIKTAGY